MTRLSNLTAAEKKFLDDAVAAAEHAHQVKNSAMLINVRCSRESDRRSTLSDMRIVSARPERRNASRLTLSGQNHRVFAGKGAVLSG